MTGGGLQESSPFTSFTFYKFNIYFTDLIREDMVGFKSGKAGK